ncbi:MAG: hypothetical protein ABI599_01565 [Flavobacteriales bacterium]
MRALWPVVLLNALLVQSQEPAVVPDTPLRFSGSVSVPMNDRQLLEHASEAWRFSFGLEPGARMTVDTATNSIVGTARFNFRSVQLNGREETMGPIGYRIRITTANGECQWAVDDLKHTGNRGAPMGGSDIGPLTVGNKPAQRVTSMSPMASVKVWEDAKGQVSQRIESVRRMFESRLRKSAGL